MILSFDVNQQTVSRSAVTSVPRKGSREYLYLSFTFSDDWTGLTKTLYVSNETYSDGIIVEKGVPVQVPVYYTQQNSFSITLCGIRGNQFVPTNVITILLEESNDTWEEVAPDPESIPYQQLIAMVQKAIEAMHAPYINTDTNTWMQWSIEQNMFVDTGIVAESATYAQQAQQSALNAVTAQNASEAASRESQSYANIAKNAAEVAAGVSSVYGVKFSGGTNPGTRTYAADGLVAEVCVGEPAAVQNDFDHIYPWSARKRCCGSWNAEGEFIVNAYEGEPGYAVDGSNGEVWIEHSLFYYKRIVNETEGTEEYIISGNPMAGFRPAPIFDRGDKAPLQKAYTAAYPLAFVDGVPTSRTGVFSDKKSLNTTMALLKAVNENYRTGTIAEQYTEMLYLFVEFATRNLQTIMRGVSTLSYDTKVLTTQSTTGGSLQVDAAYANVFIVGQTIGVGTTIGVGSIVENAVILSNEGNGLYTIDQNVSIPENSIVFSLPYKNGQCDIYSGICSSGTRANTGKYQCIYRGKESPWGNCQEFLSDLLCTKNGYKLYYLPDTRKYSSGNITSDYIELQGTIPSRDGYVKSFQVDDRYPHIIYPKELGASDTTYYSDYFEYPRFNVCTINVGGNWRYGSWVGPSFWFCYAAASTTSTYTCARLSFRKP